MIKQFYAILYVSGKENDTSSWTHEWMIQGQLFHLSLKEFMEIINIPRHTGQQDKIHLLHEMTDGEFATLLDPEVTEVYMPQNIQLKHLVSSPRLGSISFRRLCCLLVMLMKTPTLT